MPSGRMQLGELAQNAGRTIERLALISTRQLGRRVLLVLVNLLVAAVVMALPFISGGSAGPSAEGSTFNAPIGSTSLAPVDGEPTLARAAPQARGLTISAGHDPNTVSTQEVPTAQSYTLSATDTLWTIANYYGLTA